MSEEPQIIHRPPFPPKSLNFPEIINESLRKYRTGKSSKTPNAYLLYRKEYTATFKNSNLGHISTLSSEAWNSEPHEVKLTYRQYADQINEIVKREIPYCFVANKAERNSDTSDDDNESNRSNSETSDDNQISQFNNETNQSNRSNSETSDDNRMNQFNQMTEMNQINLPNLPNETIQNFSTTNTITNTNDINPGDLEFAYLYYYTL
ncbi:hypothetical protein C2G38_2121092 [Gigaspora rosea]|uniref:HMG box domain-containing protein n=1 Tax=Gigaspora rosea TaxID=44941 RepID=A0A397UAS9_9GLOM|nr:hypothetical protein C2G38_2121092 [Gigaspora rosea]